MNSQIVKIAVVIPSYKVCKHILNVIAEIGPEVCAIYVIDDCCPDKSGEFVKKHCSDSRVKILYNIENMGVGGAVMSGYKAAIQDGMGIIVKIDGDGQMDPALIRDFINPILQRKADYTKGNRFFDLEEIRNMPGIRLFGNAALSFMTKFSTGYWNLFDPTNGYTAIHANVARHIPFSKVSRRYFFETDMLFRLNTLKAVVFDIPMNAKYADEVSNLKVSQIIVEFALKHCKNFVKRIFYNYYLRDMSIASIELLLGVFLFLFGGIFGIYNWYYSNQSGIPTTAGTVMLASMPILMGLQLILAFLAFDISSVPRNPIQGRHFKEKS